MKSLSFVSAALMVCAGIACAAPAAKDAAAKGATVKVAVAEDPLEGVLLRGSTDKEKAFYEPGETMTFTIQVDASKAKKPLGGGYSIVWTRNGDDGKKDGGSAPVGAKPLVIKTCLNKPGFVSIVAHLKDAAGKVYGAEKVSFNGGAGVHRRSCKAWRSRRISIHSGQDRRRSWPPFPCAGYAA